MSDNKRYYWIKLKTDFFNQETIDFLLSQENGCQYVVLYQMLCLQVANNNGELSSKIGEIIIPYDAEKIARDTKYFNYDTIVVALELFKKLGLVYEQKDKILKISNFNEMVGSEVSSAKRVRDFRERQKALQCNTNVTQEIEYRDKILDIDNNIKEINKENRFKPPTLEEVEEYCKERNNNVDAKRFFDYYEANEWKDNSGKKVKSWKQKMIANWETNAKQQPKKETYQEKMERIRKWAEEEDRKEEERRRNEQKTNK